STAFYGNNFRLLEALEMRKERRDLERPFLSRGLQYRHFRLLHLDLVRPWIHLDAGAERQCSDLIGLIHSQALGSFRNGLHSDEMTAAEIIAETGPQKMGQLRRARLQCFEKQRHAAQLIVVWRFCK